MTRLFTVTSSMIPPSTLSIASPLQWSNTQLVMAIRRKPPLDSVPNLMRPVGVGPCFSSKRLRVPSRKVPSWKPPVT